MKHYDRAKKKWVTQEELDTAKKPRDKDVCKGRRPHDYVLVLPWYVQTDEKYQFNPEKYYDMMKKRLAFIEKQDSELKSMGIFRASYNGNESKLFICSVCKKQKYVTPKE